MLALLFDIHGNLPALEAVLDDARASGAQRYLLGGDYAVFGGWPAETVARLRKLPDATWIRGNVDRWAATEPPDGEPARSGVESCRALMDATTVAELGALPESAGLGHGTRAWHASPKTDLASFWPEPGDDELELLEGVEDRRLVFGHFHVSFDRIGAHGIELVAPGAVGIPLDGDHRAAWALMHDDGRIERRRVAYDQAASAARVREVAGGAPWGDVVAGRIERAGMA
ncbi:MAG TPA: metallophosphoesterase family protein [Solirubrobacteraceae bacterium]|nr:metallophosphoesterase family protein [Solirubrobacteraceae bacterium]